MRPFRAFTAKRNDLARSLTSVVQVFPAFDPNAPPNPLPPHVDLKALWDTGATGSFISPAAAQRLGLTAVGIRDFSHAAGTETRRPCYLVNLRLPNGVGVAGLEAVEFESPRHFEFIIGMNLITQGDFALTNVGGKSCMSFRVPSCEEIDYVNEANRLKFAGVERNAPCPCGSGKKFKKCHGSRTPPP